jgi:hypothetical protein
MAQTPNYTRIPAPRVSLVDPQTGIVANEWFRFFNNIYAITYSGVNSITAGTYGSATNVARITVNDFGGITDISSVPIAIDATQIVSGNINTARIQGAYTGITGVGTLTLGTWNATPITTTYGGTGLTSYAVGDLSYYASGETLSKLAIGSSTFILTSSGTAPQWANPTTITVGKATNLVGGAANRIAYQTAADTTSFIAAPTVSSTYLTWDGTAIQWAAVPSSMVYPGAGIPNSTGSAWGTSYGVSGTGSVVLSASPTLTGTVGAQNITTTGNTILGSSQVNTLNVGNGDLVKDASGNLGIGTSSPATKLNVVGSAIRLQNGQPSTVALQLGPVASGGDYALIRWNNTVGSQELRMYADAGFLSFYSAAAERMRIHASGGVSIGNTTDSGAGSLNVNGLIYPQQATTAGAPAYVKGAIYFDTTLNKLRVGGATAWETITSI